MDELCEEDEEVDVEAIEMEVFSTYCSIYIQYIEIW